MPPASKVLAGLGVVLTGSVFARLAYVGTQIFLARMLGPDLFGLYVLGWTVVGLFEIFAPLGVPQAIARFASIHSGIDAAKFYATTNPLVVTALVSALTLSLALALAAPYVANDLLSDPALAPVLLIFAPAVFLRTTLALFAAISRSNQEMKHAALANLLLQIANLLLVVGFYYLGMGLFGAIYAHLLALFLAFAPYYWAFGRMDLKAASLFWPRRLVKRHHLVFGLRATLLTGITIINLWVDRLMIGALASTTEVGIYQAASQLAMVPNMILASVMIAFEVAAARYYAAGDMQSLWSSYQSLARWSGHLLLPILALLIVAPGLVIALLFGRAYADAGLSLAILSFGQFLRAASGPVGVLLAMTGHERLALRISVASLVANVGLNAVLIPAFGIEGAAAASALANTGIALAGLVAARAHGHLPPWPLRLSGMVPAALASILTCWLIFYELEPALPAPVLAALGLSAAGAIYWTVLLLASGSEEERQTLRALIARLRRLPRPDPG